jgi:DNA polymerase III delta prime subunit
MIDQDHMLWVEKYRPHRVADCILPEDLKKTFQAYVDTDSIPNLILNGGPGMGKTTIARAMCDELGCDYILINCSLENSIDTLRTKVLGFASSVSLSGGRKVVIFDEADTPRMVAAQEALRAFIEEFAGNCSFIFTCNNKNKIIKPLHSRCAIIEFKLNKTEKQKLAAEFFRRVSDILTENNVTFDKKVIVEVILKFFPDYRHVLNELQKYSKLGVIDVGILSRVESAKVSELIALMKKKNYGDIRKWVANNVDLDPDRLVKDLYTELSEQVEPECIPNIVLAIAQYMRDAAFSVDHEIPFLACVTILLQEVRFK